MATPFLFPIVAIIPLVLYKYSFLPDTMNSPFFCSFSFISIAFDDFNSFFSDVIIFSAVTCPSRIACCAVGGYGFPVCGSIINAQSPIA